MVELHTVKLSYDIVYLVVYLEVCSVIICTIHNTRLFDFGVLQYKQLNIHNTKFVLL